VELPAGLYVPLADRQYLKCFAITVVAAITMINTRYAFLLLSTARETVCRAMTVSA
jgi:hypothetical protein